MHLVARTAWNFLNELMDIAIRRSLEILCNSPKIAMTSDALRVGRRFVPFRDEFIAVTRPTADVFLCVFVCETSRVHPVVRCTLDDTNFLGGAVCPRSRVNDIPVTGGASHVFRQGRMDNLSGLACGLDAGGDVAARAGGIVPGTHIRTHALRIFSAPSRPGRLIRKVYREFRDQVADTRGRMDKGFLENVVGRYVAGAAIDLNAG